MIEEVNMQCDIEVTNMFKSYEGKNVINGLNMNVASGSIYGLLGPSGCGKSTLLQCILGIMPIDSGHIYLKTNNLKDIGYMPQDLCLDDTLTIKESFDYYGTLYGMSASKIKSRIEELDKVLQLPDLDSYIKTLSGGQSRRVSIAISLLHDPELIILDEPTVGIDPLLRQEIWSEFIRMVKQQQKTIIITTHYIEEASLADRIGLMRNRVLIEEGSPNDIVSKCNSDSLESAFLTLCYKKEQQQIAPNVVPVKHTNQRTNRSMKPKNNNIDVNRIKALLRKNIRVFSRDYILVITMFIVPICQAFLLSMSIGVDFKDLKVAVQNDEINVSECQYSNTKGCIFDDGSNHTISCVLLNNLKSRKYKFVEVKNRTAGETLMNDPQYVAYMHFPKNYTKEVAKYMDDRLEYNFESQVYVHYTEHNILFESQFLNDLTNSMDYLIRKTLKNCSNIENAISFPLKFETLLGKNVKTFKDSSVSIFIAMGVFYFPCMFSITIMMSERMDGILSRSMFAGVTILELLISLFCISNMILILQYICPLCIHYVILRDPILVTSGLFAYGVIMIALGWIGFFTGILFSGITPTKSGGLYAVNGWSFTQFMLSGTVWSIEGQIPVLKAVSETLPLRVGSKTMTDIALKGWALDNPSVLKGTTWILLYAGLLIVILIVMGAIKKDICH